MATVTMDGQAAHTPALTPASARLVIAASSLGTVFEWYDFFVYGTLAALLGKLFFPSGNPTAELLSSLATFGVGFMVRPLGAAVFGHLGDRVGRKYTFLATVTLMGVSTACVGLLPTYASAGIAAPLLLLCLRVAQGLALGGEYGGAAIYVAEHAPARHRGFYTSFIQASVVGGFLLSLGVVLITTVALGKAEFAAWGWRVPFLVSLLLLALSLYLRLKLSESPVFQAMKDKGAVAKAPLSEAFAHPGNIRRMVVALFGISAGLTVIWYTAQFSSLYFLQQSALMDETEAKLLIGGASLLSAPLFVLMGHLSDRIGRKPLMVAGYGATLLLLFPLFHLLADSANPQLTAAMRTAPVTIAGSDCGFNPFAKRQASPCGDALQFLSGRGIGHRTVAGGTLAIHVGTTTLTGYSKPALEAALTRAGYPARADPARRSLPGIFAAVMVMGLLSAMTYGAVAAILVELFPARIRYTSLSIPYHIGTGFFGGLLPLISQYIVAKSGDPFGGLWYTWGVVAVALVSTAWLLPETKGRDIGV